MLVPYVTPVSPISPLENSDLSWYSVACIVIYKSCHAETRRNRL